MIPARSDVPDFDEEEQTSTGRFVPTMVSLHFVRSALRRRWLVCALSALLGLLVAAGFLVAFPVGNNAKAVLVLTHESESESSRAMATDVSLLKTRTVASRTIASLGLTMTPDEFLKSVTVVPVSSELLELTMTGPSDAEAVRRLSALTSTYLQFRTEQMSAQTNALVDGMQQRIEKLNSDVATLSKRIDELSAAGSSNTEKLTDAISLRAYIQGRIDSLRESVEDAILQNRAVVSSSGVLDPAAAEVGGIKRRIALALASGFIGGLGLGCGTVLFFAITSDRLRRRSDVAAALEVPVPVSVGRIAPLPKRWLWFPHMRTLNGRRADERKRLAHAIEMELRIPRSSGRLAVLCLDNAKEVGLAVAATAADLMGDGRSVALVDLTSEGTLDLDATPLTIDSARRPVLLRPRTIPALAASETDLRTVGQEYETAPSLELTDVVLVLADLDPPVGADHLKAWTDRVIIAVTAGHSSAEMITTAGELARAAGLELRLATLLHTERMDDSSGTAGFDQPASVHLVDVQDRLTSVEESVKHKQAVDREEAAALKHRSAEEPIADQEHAMALADKQLVEEQTGHLISAEQVADEKQAIHEEEEETPTVEEQPADEQPTKGKLTAEEELTVRREALEEERATDEEKQAGVVEEQAADEEPALADQERPAVEDHTPHEDQPVERQILNEEQFAEEEQVPVEEQVPDEKYAPATVLPEQSAGDDQAADDEERAAGLLEQLTSEDPSIEERADQDEALAEAEPSGKEFAAVSPAHPTYELPNLDGEPTIQVRVAFTYDQPSGEQTHVIEQLAKDGGVVKQLVADPDLVADPPEQTTSGLRWQLFFAENPLVQIEPSFSDDELDWSWDALGEPSSNEESPVVVAEDEVELFLEPDDVAYPSLEHTGSNGWILYIDVYRAKSTPLVDDGLNWTFDWNWDLGSEDSGSKQNGSGNGHGAAEVSAEADAR
jgi:capsular polysaccharide biosynthesis protein